MNSAATIAKIVNTNMCLFMTAEPAVDVDIVMQQLVLIQQLRLHASEGQSSGLMVGQQSEGQLSVVSPSEQMLSPQKVWLTVTDRFPLNVGLILRQHPRKQPIHLGQRPGTDFAYRC